MQVFASLHRFQSIFPCEWNFFISEQLIFSWTGCHGALTCVCCWFCCCYGFVWWCWLTGWWRWLTGGISASRTDSAGFLASSPSPSPATSLNNHVVTTAFIQIARLIPVLCSACNGHRIFPFVKDRSFYPTHDPPLYSEQQRGML